MNLEELQTIVPPPIPPTPKPIRFLPSQCKQPSMKKLKVGVAQEEPGRRNRLLDSWVEVVERDLETSEVGRQAKREEEGVELRDGVKLSLAGNERGASSGIAEAAKLQTARKSTSRRQAQLTKGLVVLYMVDPTDEYAVQLLEVRCGKKIKPLPNKALEPNGEIASL
eukprot:8370398-Karenia_brevis.AAC.1